MRRPSDTGHPEMLVSDRTVRRTLSAWLLVVLSASIMGCGTNDGAAQPGVDGGAHAPDSAGIAGASGTGGGASCNAPSCGSGGAPGSDGGGSGGGGECGSTSCGSGGVSPSDAGVGGAGVPDAGARGEEAAACDAYVDAACGFTSTCQVAAFNGNYGTLDTCKRTLRVLCLDRFSAPGASVHAADVQACAQQIAGATCAAATLSSFSACAFTGTLGPSSGCRYDAQCMTGLCHTSGYQPSCGACVARGAEGSTCVRSADCTAGLSCAGFGVSATCIRPAMLGAACDSTLPYPPCAVPLVCRAGTCQPPPTIGQACTGACAPTQPAECLSGTCIKITWSKQGQTCDIATGTACLGSQLSCGASGTCTGPVPADPCFGCLGVCQNSICENPLAGDCG